MSGIALTRDWRRRRLNKPWVVKGTPGQPDIIYIAIRGDTGEKPADATGIPALFTGATRQHAVQRILNYYGKVGASQVIGELLESKMGYHFSGRPDTRVTLLYALPAASVDLLPCRGPFASAGVHHQSYAISRLGMRIQDLSTLFKEYENQYKFYSGRVKPPISFSKFYNRLRLAHEKIVEFIEVNGIEYRPTEDDTLQISFNQDYTINHIVVTQDGMDKHLIKANQYYFEEADALTNTVTNKMLYNLSAIYSTRNAGYPWSHFVKLYVDNTTIDYDGLPQTPKASELIANSQDDINKLFMSTDTSNAVERAVQDQANQLQMLNEAASEKEEKISADLQKIAKKLSEAEGKINVVREVIGMLGINHLIEAALECLTLQTGVPMDSSFLGIPLPGTSPWEKPKPPVLLKIPKMYPVKLPKINIGQALADEIKKSLKNLGLEVMAMVMQTLAELILELCTDQDRDQIGNSPPLPSIINDYPSPNQAFKDDPTYGPGAMGGMLACLSDYGILEPDANEFFTKLSNSVSPQEICDALNGAPSTAFLEVVYNISMLRPGDTIHQAFIYTSPTGVNYLNKDIVIDFFLCIGKLVSPDFCVVAYTPTIVTFAENADVCALEDMLVEKVDADALNQLAVAYQNLDDLTIPTPSMTPGCGVVPPLTAMPALNHSVNTLFNSVFETPKASFVEDIQGLQTIMMVPATEADAERAELIEQIEEAMAQEGVDRTDLNKPNEGPASAEDFLENLMGDVGPILTRLPGYTQIQGAVDSAFETQISSLQSGINYEINPAYQEEMGGIEEEIGTEWTDALDLSEGSQKSWFWITGEGFLFYYSPQQHAGSVASSNEIKLVPGDQQDASTAADFSKAAMGLRRVQEAATPFADFLYNPFEQDAAAGVWLVMDTDDPQTQIDESETVMGEFGVAATPPSTMAADITNNLKKLWFPANLSAMNLLAAEIVSSPLFNVEEFEKLILVPKPCSDSPSGTYGDLSGFDDIIKQAKQDFHDNASSCQDERPCTVGPVEDSLIFALTSAYIQMMILEQLLKNIWLIDAYGFTHYSTNDKVIEIIRESVLRNLGTPEARQAVDLLYAGCVLHVDKLRQRHNIEFPADLNKLPDPIQDPASGIMVTIPTDAVTAFESSDGSYKTILAGAATNFGYPSALVAATYALDYMIKLRLFQMGPAVAEGFGHGDANIYERYLYNGIPTVDVLDGALSWDIRNDLRIAPYVDDAILGTPDEPSATAIALGMTNARLWNPLVIKLIANKSSGHSWASNPNLDLQGAGASKWNYNGFSDDEKDDIGKNGAIALEKYVKFDLDINYYKRLRNSLNQVDQQIYALIQSEVENLIGISAADAGNAWGVDITPYPMTNYQKAPSAPWKTDPTIITLTVSQEKFSNLYGLFRRPTAVTSMATTLSSLGVEGASMLTEAQDIISALQAERESLIPEITYYYEWRTPGGSSHILRRASMKGKLNEGNYEAVRYWFNEWRGDRGNLHDWDALSEENSIPTTALRGFYPETFQEAEFPGPHSEPAGGGPNELIAEIPGITTTDGWSAGAIVSGIDRDWQVAHPSGDGNGPITGHTYEGFNGRIGVFYRDRQSGHGVDPTYRVVFVPQVFNTLNIPNHVIGVPGGGHVLAGTPSDIYSFDEASQRSPVLLAPDTVEPQPASFLNLALHTYPSHDSYVDHYASREVSADSARPYYSIAAESVNVPADLRVLYDATANALTDVLDTVPASATEWDLEEYDIESVGRSTGHDPTNGQVFAISADTDLFDNSQSELSAMSVSAWKTRIDEIDNLIDIQNTIIDNLAGDIAAADLLTTLVTNVRIGARLAYYSPVMAVDDPLLVSISERLGYGSPYGSSLRQSPSQMEVFYRTKSGYLVEAKDGYVFNASLGMAEESVILPDLTAQSFELKLPLSRDKYPMITVPDPNNPGSTIEVDTRPTIEDIAGSGNYMQNVFEAHKKDLYGALAAQPDVEQLFSEIVSVKDMVALLFLYGLNISERLERGQGPEHQFKRLFNDTKAALRTGLGATFHAADYCYEDPDSKSAAQKAQEAAIGMGMEAAIMSAKMGASFILKMLIETPLRILKGLAEVADPHVIVGKIIKDQTRHIIKQVEPYWPGAQLPLPCPPDNAPKEMFTIANDLNQLTDILEPTFVDFLRSNIARTPLGDVPEAVRMTVSKDGVDMIGKLPLLFLPPPFIFGIIYILLDLINKDMLTLNDTSESQIVCPADLELGEVTLDDQILPCIKPPAALPKVIEPCLPPADPGAEVCQDTPTGPVTTCDD